MKDKKKKRGPFPHRDEIMSIRDHQGRVFISLACLCRAVGVAGWAQETRVKEYAALAEGYRKGGAGGLGLLRADLIPLWLLTLNPLEVTGTFSPQLINYQRGAARVLWRSTISSGVEAVINLLPDDSPATQALKIANLFSREK